MVGTLRLHSLAQGGGAAPLLSRDGGFASLCLTTWRRRRSESIVRGKVPAAIRGGYNSEGRSSFSSVASIPIRGVHLRAAAVDNFRLQTLAKVGAGNGIRTRDFDLGKVALYH